jgi:hypothetical protein
VVSSLKCTTMPVPRDGPKGRPTVNAHSRGVIESVLAATDVPASTTNNSNRV